MTDELREKLADLCRRQWSERLRQLFTVSTHMYSGDIVIWEGKVKRLRRQMDTPYADLSEQEKDSNRKEADKFLEMIR